MAVCWHGAVHYDARRRDALFISASQRRLVPCDTRGRDGRQPGCSRRLTGQRTPKLVSPDYDEITVLFQLLFQLFFIWVSVGASSGHGAVQSHLPG